MGLDFNTITADPEFINANPATKAAIFDKYALQDPDIAGANPATQQAIKEKLTGFATTPEGAVVGRAETKAKLPTTSTWLQDVGGAGVLGGAMGLAAPQILKSTGGAISSLPFAQARAIGLPLMYAGEAAKNAPPVARVVSGFISGGTSETAGKAAEGMGATPFEAEAARLAGGAISPELVRLGASIVTNLYSHFTIPGNVTDKMLINVAREAKSALSKTTGKSLTEKENQYIDSLVANLHGTSAPGKPLETVGTELQKGAQDIRSTAAQRGAAIVGGAEQQSAQLYDQAHRVINNAETAARAEIDAANQSGIPLGKRIEYVQNLKTQVLDKAKQTRAAVGQDRSLADIGADLRNAADKRGTDFRTAASDAYTATKAEVDNTVKNLESKGITVDTTPEYKRTVAYLKSQLLPGKRSPEVAAAYKKILDQITVKTAEGEPYVPPSFQAVDDARRMLGEAFRGQPAEGYAAIGQTAQKELYARLAKIQRSFAGDKQADLLANYADSRPGLEIFGSKAGQKLLAVDPKAKTQFITDASNIPNYYFKSPTSFNNLIDLVGSKDLALKAANDYTANQLAGKETSKQVNSWITTNREFLRAVPEVNNSVLAYRNTLESAERVAANLDVGVNKLASQQKALVSQGKAKAGQIRQGGELQAGALTTEAEAGVTGATKAAARINQKAAQAADTIFANSGFAKNVRGLIEGGDYKAWELAAPIIERSPEAKRAIYDATRQVAAEMSTTANATLKFKETIRPAMEKFGMLGKTQADDIERQIAEIEAQRLPNKTALGAIRRVILQGIAGYSSTLGSRGAGAGFSLVSDIPTQNALSPSTQQNQNALAR
jgi:hypothetical protein